jgi:all-trans-8'-apo-beta-carotenal 15,15'-oxygenase
MKFEPQDAWQVLLGTNHPGDMDYEPQVEGRIPEALAGTLYRNGPGIFERNGQRKQHLLDGDGLIQCFDLARGKVRYRSRFVPTPKFEREAAAGRFRQPTWTTLAPRWLENLPGYPRNSQAGITVYLHQGQLMAMDEVGPPFALDPDTLAPRGFFSLVPAREPRTYKAHAKSDGRSGDWVLLGWDGYRRIHIEVIVRGGDGTVKLRRRVPAPRNSYIHDYFATDRHVIVSLQPISCNAFPMLLGLRSYTDSLSWKPELGGIVLVIPLDASAPVRAYEAPATFMWHSFNAYETSDGIVADFVGYAEPDHFIGERALLKTLMRGEQGIAQAPGLLRRYRIPRDGGSLVEEVLMDGSFEFPSVHPAVAGCPHRFGFATTSPPHTAVQDGLAVVDLQQCKVTDRFTYGPAHYVGEPIFARDPAATPGDERGGWLLSLVLDGNAKRSFLAIFDARRVSQGPLARLLLTHHCPLSFHGCWRNASTAP